MQAGLSILIDLDGTLVDTCPDLLDTLNLVIRPHGGVNMSREAFEPFIGRGARHMIQRALAAERIELDPATLEAVYSEFLEHYESRIARLSQPFPGAVAVLDRLVAEGALIAVCTNKLEGLARRLLADLGIEDRLAAITGPDTYGSSKPDPQMLLRTIAAMGGTPDRAVMVGDSRYDLEAARNARLPFIGVSFGYTETPMAEMAPDILIDSFAALPEALDRLG